MLSDVTPELGDREAAGAAWEGAGERHLLRLARLVLLGGGPLLRLRLLQRTVRLVKV